MSQIIHIIYRIKTADWYIRYIFVLFLPYANPFALQMRRM